jgi:RIO kinase 2
MYFDRDVGCVKRYFERRFKYVCDEEGPFFKDAVKGIDPEMRLDIEVEASGFSKKMAKDLERFVEGDGGDRNELEAEKDSQEVDVENQDEVELEEDEDGLPEDPQVDDPRLAEEIGGLAIGDDLAVKPMSGRDFGLMPLEIQHDPDVAAEKLHNKKKAAGWAI